MARSLILEVGALLDIQSVPSSQLPVCILGESLSAVQNMLVQRYESSHAPDTNG